MKKVILVTVALVSALTLAGTVSAKDKVGSKVLKEEDKIFVKMFGPVRFADAYGSRDKGPHGTYGSFPPGFETPPHVHTHAYRAIVVKGEMTNPFEGEKNPPVMIPGSYWSVKAGELHTTACVSATPCEFFMYGDEGFDFITEE